MFNFGVKNVLPTKASSFGFGVKKDTIPSAPTGPTKPVIVTHKFSDSLGGGVYNSVKGEPNTLVNTGHSTYGGEQTKAGQQRDDIFPVGLGGVNSDKRNIRYEPLNKSGETDTDQIEKQAINDYKAGRISLPEARLQVMTAKQRQVDKLDTDPYSLNNLWNGLKDTVKKGGEFIADTGKSILQAPQRAVTSAAIEPAAAILSLAKNKDVKPEFVPKSKFEKAVFGKEPIKGMFRETTDLQKSSQDFLNKANVNKNLSAGASLIAAPLIVGSSKALDLFPIGGEKKAVEKIAASKSSEDILKIIQPLFKDRSAEEISALSKKLVDITKPEEVKNVIKEFQGFNPQAYIKEMMANRAKAESANKPGLIQKATDLYKLAKNKLVDSNAPIEDTLRAAEKNYGFNVLPTNDITHNIDRVYRAPAIAGQFAKDNGLTDVIKNVDNLDALDQYLIAKHSQDLAAKGIETGRNIEKDKQLVSALAPQYDQSAQLVNDYSKKLLYYSVDSGLISKDLAEKLKVEYPNYVPMQRVFDEFEKANQFNGGKAVASLSKQSVVQSIKGSKREIESPLNSLLAKTNDAFLQGEKNKAAQTLTSYHNLPDNPFGLRRITDQSELKSGESTLSVLRNGKKETWVANPDIVNAAKSLNVQQLNILGKIFAFPVRVAKLGITGLNPAFGGANIAKDQLTAFINSKNGINTSLNPRVFLKSLYEAVGHGDLYQEMVRNGAGGTSFDIARNQIPETVARIRSNRTIGSKIAYTVKHPSELLRAVEDVFSRSEELTRIQQYAGTKDALLKKGMGEANAMIEASKAARENTANFARRGEWGQVLNSAFLYLNAGIQGSRSLIRSFSRKPAETSTKIIASVFTPVAMATLWNLSDPERSKAYQDIPDWEKDNNLIYIPPNPTQDKGGKWNVIKIPLPQEVNNLSSIVRKSIEQSKGVNKVKFQDIADSLVGTVSPVAPNSGSILSAATPQIVKPSIEYAVNKNLFTGSPTVPMGLDKLSPELQYKDNTSGTIIKLSKMTGLSPLKAEAWIKSTFGGLGSNILNQVDKAMAEAGQIPKDQIGGQGFLESIKARFNKATGGQNERNANSALAQDMQKVTDQNYLDKKAFQPTYDKIQQLVKDGNKEEAQKILNGLSDKDYSLYKKLKTADKTKETKGTKSDIYPTFQKIQDLISSGNTEEAQSLVDAMSDEEYKAYKSLKKTFKD